MIAAALGLPPLEAATVGGASDGNFTAGLGVPTLDGLGAVGDGAHAEGEHTVVAAMPERAALVAALVADLLEGRAAATPAGHGMTPGERGSKPATGVRFPSPARSRAYATPRRRPANDELLQLYRLERVEVRDFDDVTAGHADVRQWSRTRSMNEPAAVTGR